MSQWLLAGASALLLLVVSGSAARAAITVRGNRLVENGHALRLLGVNRSGIEYACVQGWGFFDGPSDAASLRAIRSWHANMVRIPLNESCWVGASGVPPQYSGARYRRAISDYVARVNRAGMIALLELHWSSPSGPSTGQAPMPDAARSPRFWASVAQAFRSRPRVLFELFNEPYPDGNTGTAEAWRCWRDGGRCRGVSYAVAGMQSLVTAVRSAGARQPILLGGVQYSNDLAQWLTHRPADPAHALAAAWHAYRFNTCNTTSCWNGTVAPTSARVPLVVTEYGPDEATDGSGRLTHTGWLAQLGRFLDGHARGEAPWVWDVWGSTHDLITNYSGAPTPIWGSAVRARFERLAEPAR